jgi:ribonuclease P protein component
VGIVVPKHRHTVAERNRLKRRLREIARKDVLPRLWRLPAPVDLLVRARPQAYDAALGGLRSELTEVMEAL